MILWQFFYLSILLKTYYLLYLVLLEAANVQMYISRVHDATDIHNVSLAGLGWI